MFTDYATAIPSFSRLPRADRRHIAPDSEIRLRIKRTLSRKAA